MEWISIKDKLPSRWGDFLTYNDKHNFVAKTAGFRIYKYRPKDKKFWDYNLKYNIEVTHWMPLPNPPET